jgi:hypothetical protein
MSKQRRYLSRGEIAKRFGVSSRTVRRWEKNEKLDFPPVIMMSKRGYFDLDEIEAFERSLVRRSVSADPSSVQSQDAVHA